MRSKRKRKRFKMNGKLLFSLLVSLTILTAVEPIPKSEALADTSFTEPINIMYSLMTKSKFDQFDEANGLFYYYFRSQLKIKQEKSIDQTEIPQSEKETKVNPEKKVPLTNDITNQSSDIPETEATQEENTQVLQQNEQKLIYLTFDDGPSPYTMQILEALNSYDMKATFFMLEPNMRAHQEELNAIIENGHIPALHGVTHRVDKIYRSEQTVVDEMTVAQATLMNLTGTVSHLIRTPYGSAPYMKPSYKQAVEAAGFQLWDWTIDSEDWKYRNGEFVPRVIHQVENFHYKERPLVVLMHDRKSTAEHLPALLNYLNKNGYKAELLNEQLTAFHF